MAVWLLYLLTLTLPGEQKQHFKEQREIYACVYNHFNSAVLWSVPHMTVQIVKSSV